MNEVEKNVEIAQGLPYLCVGLDVLLLLLLVEIEIGHRVCRRIKAACTSLQNRQRSALVFSSGCIMYVKQTALRSSTHLEEALTTSLTRFPPSLPAGAVSCVVIALCKVFWRGS